MSDPIELILRAKKMAQPQLGFFLFLSGSSLSLRIEEAADLYVLAANQYRLRKQFSDAGDQFVAAADLHQSISNFNDEANQLIEAYKCYKAAAPTDAIQLLKRAIAIFLNQNGQFRRAANFTNDLAELYEQVGDFKAAADSYEQAGDYFSTDHAEALASKAYLKSADLTASSKDYKKAIELYDPIILLLSNNALSRWGLKDLYLKVILCVLAMEDAIEGLKRLEKYLVDDPAFEQTREYKLLAAVLAAIEQGDEEAFLDAVFDFDQIQKLDKLKTQLLLKAKEMVVAHDDDGDLL